MLFLTTILYLIFLIISLSISSSLYIWWTAFFIVVLILLASRVVGKNKYFLVLPVVLIAAPFALIPFLAPQFWTYFFIFLSTGALFLTLYLRGEILSKDGGGDRRRYPRFRKYFEFNKAANISVLAFCYMAFFAMAESLPFWAVLTGFFLSSLLIFWETLRFSISEKTKALVICLSLAMAAAEFAWALSFWPLGFFSHAVILLAIMYSFIDIVDNIAAKKISTSKIIFDLGISLTSIVLVMGTSKWLPL